MRDCNSNGSIVEHDVAGAASAIVAGGVVVYPTETVYGLGVDALNSAALERLVWLKGRDPGKPISVLIAATEMLHDLAADIPAAAVVLMREFWPGPLTIVFPTYASLSAILTGDTQTIGVRLSSHPIATGLVAACGRPITAPSANPAGKPPPNRIAEARAYFGANVDVYLDDGELRGEPVSTVVNARDARILRQGAIGSERIEAALREAGC